MNSNEGQSLHLSRNLTNKRNISIYRDYTQSELQEIINFDNEGS